MHVYTWMAHLDIRIDQNTPFLIKDWKKFQGRRYAPSQDPAPSVEGTPPTLLGASILTPSALDLGASWPPKTKCLDPPLVKAGAIAPFRTSALPPHKTLFDELKASARCKKERSVDLKMCKNAFPTGSPPRTPLGAHDAPKTPSRLGRGHPSPYSTLLAWIWWGHYPETIFV